MEVAHSGLWAPALSHLPEPCKRHPFRAEPSSIGHYMYTEYPRGELRSTPGRITQYPQGELRSTLGGLKTYFW